ncbi:MULTISPECIES: histidine kinase [Thermocrispum]|jgi:two-component system LytT family sensor kinase|uniref:Histidine kinase n=1 Tax=Thermocrispum agreste TaxID=37925 RepID=A0A2W4JKL3_9PSEU|nr:MULTISPECIES: histidine kinase [Thermocrispum]PZM99630.1 MAG: sensor histidine kinase [Thermocrispum agreste]
MLSRGRSDTAATLRRAHKLSRALRDGLRGDGVFTAARQARKLLHARAVGLAGLDGAIVWSGAPRHEEQAQAMVNDVLHDETHGGHAELTVLPLDVADEIAGAIVVEGDVSNADVHEVAVLVSEALERARLEASAEQALQSELRALRAEISPHFVYNALTVIASLVRSDPDRARDLMLDFADYIRYSLARHGEYTTVADEFHAIEAYLTLQRAVLGERLRVQVRVAPDVLAVPLPCLVLQPLVENAIRHGIEPSGETGTVQVQGEAEGNDCVISVEDDGVGMQPERAEQILAGKGSPDSVGLSNVDRRLRTVYGPWYGLVVETAPGEGTRVIVRVPLFQPGVLPS